MKNYFVGEQILDLNRTLCAKGPCSHIIVYYFAKEIGIKGVCCLSVVSCVSHAQLCCTYRGGDGVVTGVRLCVPCCDALERCRWMCCMWFSAFSTAAPRWRSRPPSLFSTESALSFFFSLLLLFPAAAQSEGRTGKFSCFYHLDKRTADWRRRGNQRQKERRKSSQSKQIKWRDKLYELSDAREAVSQ